MRSEARGSLDGMPTLVKDPPPAEFEALLAGRRRLGQDRFDEVWEGVLHMNPRAELRGSAAEPAVGGDPGSPRERGRTRGRGRRRQYR
jgi:hypothetical protein